MNKTKIIIAGASGFVGKYLIEALIKRNYYIIALSRKNRSSENSENIKWVTCDLFSRKDTLLALKGCSIAFYLTHSMLPSSRLSQGNFADYDLILADNFSRSASYNGLHQIIYLGGIIPEDFSLSSHLLSRLEVERTLSSSKVPVTSLRAGLIMGPEGSSFRIMYNLVKFLPVMICPSWTGTLSNPISIWDTIKYLVYCVNNNKVYNKQYDIGGETTISYLEMMRILGKKLGRKRILLIVPFFSPELSKLWVSKVTGAPKDLVYPLIGSLKTHMVPNINLDLPEKVTKKMSYSESIDKILCSSEELKRIPQGFKYSGVFSGESVRSVQRLQTLYRFTAEEVSIEYFNWLGKIFPFLYTRTINSRVTIFFRGIKYPLIEIEKDIDFSSNDYCLFYIQKGLLSKKTNKGRLIFRTIIGNRYTMVEIHDFAPRLPWFIYKYTQALIHLFTMKIFNRYLLNLNRDTITKS
jgi:uncharacterized protein YbjT (DUF2867 family)